MSNELVPVIENQQGILNLINKDELMSFVKSITAKYENLIITDDEEQFKEAKARRAELNKVSIAIDNKRKKIKQEFEKPLKLFEKDMKDVKAEVDKVIGEMDDKLNEVIEKKRAKKQLRIQELIEEYGKGFRIDIANQWLNQTYKENQIIDDIKMIVYEKELEASTKEKNKQIIQTTCDGFGIVSKPYLLMLDDEIELVSIIKRINEEHQWHEQRKDVEKYEEEIIKIENETSQLPEHVMEIPNDLFDEKITRTISVCGTKEQLKKMNDYCMSIGITILAV
ncbi:DUF1351 domain-containing protein [Globicatella sanguinis]